MILAGDHGGIAQPAVVRSRYARLLPILGLPLARVLLALGAQTALALALAAAGRAGAWRWAAAWWVAWLVPVNAVTVTLLVRRQRRQGRWFGDLFFHPSTPARRDLPWYLVALAVGLPAGVIPNLLLGRWLWGSAFGGTVATFAALPAALVWALMILVPLTQGLAEPPLYLGVVLPGALRLGASRRRAVVVGALSMAAQNAFFPFLWDWRFALWRGLMFLPLCLWLAWLVARRPSLLPYLAVAHGMMNVSLALLSFRVSVPVG